MHDTLMVTMTISQGMSAHGGHYVADVLNWLTDEWYVCVCVCNNNMMMLHGIPLYVINTSVRTRSGGAAMT